MYTLTFSKKVDGQNTPFYLDGVEATLQVEAESKSSAIYHETTKAYCELHGCSVRRVN